MLIKILYLLHFCQMCWVPFCFYLLLGLSLHKKSPIFYKLSVSCLLYPKAVFPLYIPRVISELHDSAKKKKNISKYFQFFMHFFVLFQSSQHHGTLMRRFKVLVFSYTAYISLVWLQFGDQWSVSDLRLLWDFKFLTNHKA